MTGIDGGLWFVIAVLIAMCAVIGWGLQRDRRKKK